MFDITDLRLRYLNVRNLFNYIGYSFLGSLLFIYCDAQIMAIQTIPTDE